MQREVVAAGLQCLGEAGGPCCVGWRIAMSAEHRGGMAQLTAVAPYDVGGHHVMAACNELQRQSGSEGGVGRPKVTRPKVLGVAWGPESAPATGERNKARARLIGDFPLTRGPGHRERWRPTGGP
jgi:hypothetical protein